MQWCTAGWNSVPTIICLICEPIDKSCKDGCYFNNMCINHVLYSHDICLLAPTASAIQTLLDICYEYGIDNDILFNLINSVCTVFKPKAYKLYLPTVSLTLML